MWLFCSKLWSRLLRGKCLGLSYFYFINYYYYAKYIRTKKGCWAETAVRGSGVNNKVIVVMESMCMAYSQYTLIVVYCETSHWSLTWIAYHRQWRHQNMTTTYTATDCLQNWLTVAVVRHAKQEDQLALRNRASAMHFSVAKLLSIAVIWPTPTSITSETYVRWSVVVLTQCQRVSHRRTDETDSLIIAIQGSA